MKFQTVDLTNPDLDLDTDFIHKLCEVEPRLRIDRQEIFSQTPIRTQNDIIFYLADTLTQYPQERCYAVFLDAAMLFSLMPLCTQSDSHVSAPVSPIPAGQLHQNCTDSSVAQCHRSHFSPQSPFRSSCRTL